MRLLEGGAVDATLQAQAALTRCLGAAKLDADAPPGALVTTLRGLGCVFVTMGEH